MVFEKFLQLICMVKRLRYSFAISKEKNTYICQRYAFHFRPIVVGPILGQYDQEQPCLV